jgi:hypothetical protein
MDVAFSNGEKRQYERLKPDGDGAVLVVIFPSTITPGVDIIPYSIILTWSSIFSKLMAISLSSQTFSIKS